ncbi:MAG: hypothetical protein A2754_00640 [Candidatus Magasanikbacteria bacterium RIFCSPHIGHO2_01_FULL_47_8]|uniref:Peptidoglycan binding-like domain-containing protein n=1 Tax=Candidatus Magasanikbacteria bacterium RIFCSPHIGHO2_01_FULL_47_8 TaxID=1798673 RepID=A0A1F6MEV5_9BACT|nr:MAG: hypothetical protein A2754_00640 [Candidatus Magasanikbacteria bacterium RIFCSPHIGHO2_01_FULL_47_8]
MHKKLLLGPLAFVAIFLSCSLAVSNKASAVGDMVTQLKFNETSGTKAVDSSGNGNFGTLVNGPTWTTGGKIGGAINFDGVNDYVATNAEVGGLNAKTFAFWIKPGAKMKNWAGLVLEAGSFNSSKYVGFAGFSNMTVALYQGYANGNEQFYSSAVPVTPKQWNHVVGTISKATGLIKVYVNGVLKNTSSWPAMINATLYNPAGGIKMGGTPGQTYAFLGQMDDAIVYNRALSDQEVANLYTSYSSSTTPTPPPPTDTTPPATVATNPCSGFYSTDFNLISGQDNTAPVVSTKPAKGARFSDPAYHTCVVRATDHTAEGTAGFIRNDYSRRQTLNADSSKFLAYALDGSWLLYDAKTLTRIKNLTSLGGDAEPQWHPTQPEILYYLPTNGVGMKIYELNVVTNATWVVGDFSARVKARWSTANAVWTKSEGSPSADGRYWAFMVDSGSWSSLGLFTWDMQTDTIIAMYDTNGDRPDHLSMSPSGNYVVSSWDSTKGTVALSRDFLTQRQVNVRTEHSDIALDANGDDAYVSIDYGSADGDVFMVNLRTGVRTNLFASYLSGTATAFHFSGKAFNKPGWVLVSTYADYGGPRQWLHRKIFAVELTANPRILNIAHHHVDPYSEQYWDEPHASVNRDFTKIMFNSNWNAGNTDVDDYIIELPASAIPTIGLVSIITTPVIAGEKIASSSQSSALTPAFIFTRNLKIGYKGEDVRQLQKFLNAHGFTVSPAGAGSLGKETTYYGAATSKAVTKFQEKYKDELLKPLGLTRGNGVFNTLTRKKIQTILNLRQ